MSPQPLVHCDDEILQGTPVFAGSRVPVESVLASVDSGIDMTRLQEAYPWLTDEHVEEARVYVKAHKRVPQAGLSTVFGPGRKLRTITAKARSSPRASDQWGEED